MKTRLISVALLNVSACSSGDWRTALQIPELGLKLPFGAIGSGYADNEH